jgi:mannan endo-1,4-beta-mannosidase
MIAIIITICLAPSSYSQNDLRHFITRSGNKLMEGEKEYRFISFNIPNLHLVEDNMAFSATNEWRFPDEFEITDALTTVKQMGGRAARSYVISICRKIGPNAIPCHVKRPGEFNEESFRALDKVLEVANRVGVRVIIPLVDNWKWWGGIEQYAEYHDKPAIDFWTNPEIIADFKKTVTFIVNRRNSYTGVLYKDDKALLAWETGNELYGPYSWTREIAAHIKSLDSNHLIWDGFYIGHKEIQPEALEDPNIDIVSSHHYPAPNKGAAEIVADIIRFREQIAGKKVYIVGEFGFIPPDGIEKILDVVIANGLSGAMIWSLRYHNRDGGFYWHSEPASASLYNPYHYPGFPSGEGWNETATLKLMRAKAFAIQGLTEPPSPTPEPPRLLPISSPAEISWLGSVGASSYAVERATRKSGPWKAIAQVDDTWVRYRPLFSDTEAKVGFRYFYRVRARNVSGASAPSNVVGPVVTLDRYVIDELIDFSHIFAREGNLTLETANARPYKEDPHRLKGTSGDWVVYRMTAPLRSAKVLTLFEKENDDLEFYLSRDGKEYRQVESKVTRFSTEANPYGYKLPVMYELEQQATSGYFLKIVFKGDAQISRIECRQRK